MPRKKAKDPTAAAIAYGRSRKGWSQEELASRLFMATGDTTWTRDRVTRIETGRSHPRPAVIRELSRVLGMPSNVLVDGISSRSGGDTAGYRRFAGAVQAVAA